MPLTLEAKQELLKLRSVEPTLPSFYGVVPLDEWEKQIFLNNAEITSYWDKVNPELRNSIRTNHLTFWKQFGEKHTVHNYFLKKHYSENDVREYISIKNDLKNIFTKYKNTKELQEKIEDLSSKHFKGYYTTDKSVKSNIINQSDWVTQDLFMILPIIFITSLLFVKLKRKNTNKPNTEDLRKTISIPISWIKKAKIALVFSVLIFLTLETTKIQDYRKNTKIETLCSECTFDLNNFFNTSYLPSDLVKYKTKSSWKGTKILNENKFNKEYYIFVFKSTFMYDFVYLVLSFFSLTFLLIGISEFKKRFSIRIKS